MSDDVFADTPELPVLEIRLAGGYYFGQLERLIRELEPLTTLSARSNVSIDLGGLAFIGPTALALLLAASMRVGDLDMPILIYPPRNRLTHNYLLRMDFVRHFMHAPEYPEPFARKEPVGFRPCANFTTAVESIAVAREMSKALTERAQIESSSLNALQVCLHELSENVIYHADTPLGGFAAVAASSKRREIEIGIVDLGIGIRTSLAKNPQYESIVDDVAAVETAMRPTVSSTPERNSGYGLAWTQLMLLMNGGSLRLRSGTGAATLGFEAGGLRFESKETTLPGTLVSLRARLDQPLDAMAIWRELDTVILKSNAQRTPASDH
jgi:hypothetical protein